MSFRLSALRAATVLTAASAVLWVGSAIAAPLLSYSDNSATFFAPLTQDQRPVDELDSADLAPDLQRQMVRYPTEAAPGTIVIDTAQTHLYYVLGGGKAIRYGIGVGRDGFTWSGSQAVTRMAEWPDWSPPQEMIARQPYLPRWMAGGKGNPLGARAIYLGSTVYRIHGTNAPETIGTRVSSGCIRMINADVADLYSRITVGTKVIVLPNHGHAARIAAPAPAPAPASVAPLRLAAPLGTNPRTAGIY
jgi:lipoprotein-anchoring transpeptidase ErfK/SrfK